MQDTGYGNIVVIGASGALGQAFVERLVADNDTDSVHINAFSRSPVSFASPDVHTGFIDLTSEQTIERAAATAAGFGPIDLVLVTTGILHTDILKPEKSLRDLSAEKFQRLFAIDTIGPALVAKHFLPELAKDRRAVFAALSARVGSIGDNRSGGWYAYRAAKAALNMIIKNAAIEMGRRYKDTIVVGLHPGTVDSHLSKPFQSHVPPEKLFTPDFAVSKLLAVIDNLTPVDTGKCFAWDGQPIPP
jgi:NAD(P)-dependent dehydrogenase (short-subunit alcohol dehydrogenase family)